MRFLLVLILLSSRLYAQGVSLAKTATFSAVRWSHEDVSDLIGTVERFVRTAAASDSVSRYTFRSEGVSLSDGLTAFGQSPDFSVAGLRGAPPLAYSITYDLETGRRSIRTVRVEFSDYERKLSITGESPEQVEALLILLQARIEPHTVWYGGADFRLWGGLALLVLGGLLTFATQIKKSPVTVVISWIGPLVTLSVWIFPWSHWFPGTLVTAGSAEFLVRYGPLISFIGLVITVVSFLYAILSNRPATPTTSGAASGGPPPPS